MKNKHIICFDFDDTLVFTSNLAPYRKTNEGRAFIATNPDKIETSVCLPGLVSLFNKLKTKATLRILTNSSENIVRSILKKHEFEIDDLNRFYANQHKPFATGFEKSLIATNYPRDKIVLIGDSNIDLLTSHQLGIHSIFVSWGGLRRMPTNKAPTINPSKVVNNLSELENSIDIFLRDKHLNKIPWINENVFRVQSPEKRCTEEKDIEIHTLGSYYPTGHENFYWSDSNEILRFKDIKNFSIEELHQGVLNQYFYNGKLKTNCTMNHYFDYFKDKLIKKTESLNLSGNILFIGSPNSLPEFCYKSDVNQMMVNFLNGYFNGEQFNKDERLIFRVYPKPEAHLGGNRNNIIQYQTLGINYDCHYIHDFKNIAIFDDITTTGSQLISIATIIRDCGYKGNIIGITLGTTTSV